MRGARPAEVGAALEAGVAAVQIFGVEVDRTLGRGARGRRRDTDVAAEASLCAADLRVVEFVPAGTRGEGQRLRDDVHVDRSEYGLLRIAARDVVVERGIVAAHI